MFRKLVIVALCGAVSACSGLTQMQDTVGRFDQGAHAVAYSEMAFLRQVQAVDCAHVFYSSALSWSAKATDALDLSGRCEPTIITNDQLAARQRLVDTITLYADKIQALATNDSNKTLDRNAQGLAGKINAIVRDKGLSKAMPVAQDVEAAMVAIAEMALDQRRFKDVRGAARDMQPALAKVVEALQSENSLFAQGMAGKIEQLEIQLHIALSKSREFDGARSFLDVIAARDIFRQANALGLSPGMGVAKDGKVDPLNAAVQLNGALDAILNANDALANAGTGGVIAAVNDLVARAKHAQDLLSSLR